MTFYKKKYLKYKSKVQKLTNQFGGESKDCVSIISFIEKLFEPNLIVINNKFKNSNNFSPGAPLPFDIQNLSSNDMTIKDFKSIFKFWGNRYLEFSSAGPTTEKIIDILSEYDQKGIQTIKDLYDEYKRCKEGSSNESSNEEKSESRSSSDDKKELSQDELRKLFDKFQRNKKLSMPLLARLLTVKSDNDLYNLSLKLRLSIGFPENLFQNDLTTGKQYGDLLAIIYTQNVDKENQLDFNGFVNFVKCGVNRDFVDPVASNISCKNQRESEEKQRREAEERQRREREQREERERERQQRERREAEERKRQEEKEDEVNDELLAKYLQEEEDRKIAEQEQSNIEMNNPQQKRFPVFQQPVYSQQSPSKNNYNQNQSLGNKYGIPMRGQAQGVQSPNASQYGIPMRGQTQGAQAQNVFQPSYMPQPGFQGFQQSGYQGFQQPGYQGFQQPGYPQPGYQQPYMPQPGYPQPGYPQPGYQQPYMPQPGYQGFQQPMYPQSGYQQPGFGNQQQNPNQNNQFGGKLEPDYNGIKFRIYKK